MRYRSKSTKTVAVPIISVPIITANNDAPAWMAMTIPDKFCNDGGDHCKDDVRVKD